MLIHLMQELLIDVFQIALVSTHMSHIVIVILDIVDICVTTCTISTAIYATLARRAKAIIVSVAHQVSIAIYRIVIGLDFFL